MAPATRASAASAVGRSCRTTSRAPRAGRRRSDVTLRNLRTDTFVDRRDRDGGASARPGYPIGGGVFTSSARARPWRLLRGRRVHAAAERAPAARRRDDYEDWLRGYLTLFCPSRRRRRPGPTSRRSRCASTSRPGASGGGPQTERFGERPRDGEPRCSPPATSRASWALAQELQAGAETPFEYVERVEAYLDDGFAYSERRRAAAATLDGFLFDAKIGFCQQFSGAEALLLRMGGVPARVATGFTTGSFDEKEQEYVVRDLDAHSWVEAWFPGYRLGDARPDAGDARRRARSPATASRGDRRRRRRARRTSAASA